MTLAKGQLMRNSAWTLLELCMYPALMIYATKVFIDHLGIGEYALWMLVSNIAMGINLLNIGVGDSNIRLISKFRAEKDHVSIYKALNFNFSLAVLLCLAAIVVGWLFYFTGFIGFFSATGSTEHGNIVLLVACSVAGIKFVEQAVVSVFKGFERFDISSRMTMISRNSVMIGSLLVVITGYDLVSVMLATLTLSIANVLGQIFFLRSFDKPLFLALLHFPSNIRSGMAGQNGWYWLQNSIGLGGFLADKLFVAYVANDVVFGYYSIASQVATQIHNFFTAFGGFFFPRVSYKTSRNDNISSLYAMAKMLVTLPGWLLLLSLFLAGDWAFRLWLGEETYRGAVNYIHLFLGYEAILLLIIVPLFFLNGTKAVRLNSFFEISLRVSHCIGMVVGYLVDGVEGVIIGLMISTMLNIPLQYHFFEKTMSMQAAGHVSWRIVLPLIFLVVIAFPVSLGIKVTMACMFLLSYKFTYFDPAWSYAKGIFHSRISEGSLQD